MLPLLAHRLRPVLDGLDVPYEVVTVDDGSTDASAVILQRLRHEWPEVRVVRLRANAGHQAAISAGLARSRGRYSVTIDADLQDPPEVIAEMLHLAKSEGVDVVYGVRNDRSTDTAFKRGTARAFYATMRAVSGTDAPPDAGDFRLMSRATVDAVNALPEHHRVLRLVVPALGFPSAQVTYKREERAAGHSKYPLTKMIKLSIDSLTSHSMAPLRLATWCGLLGGVLSLLILVYALISVWSGHAVAGWASTVVTVAAIGSIQLLCLGLLGEYVGRMYTMMQGIPTYFVAYDSAEIRRDSRSRVEAAAAAAPRSTLERVRPVPASEFPGGTSVHDEDGAVHVVTGARPDAPRLVVTEAVEESAAQDGVEAEPAVVTSGSRNDLTRRHDDTASTSDRDDERTSAPTVDPVLTQMERAAAVAEGSEAPTDAFVTTEGATATDAVERDDADDDRTVATVPPTSVLPRIDAPVLGSEQAAHHDERHVAHHGGLSAEERMARRLR
ncbi:putative glycosyltransferase [Mobilicoccus pelagius NBRC 104925]|uniref:Putative glycosyltransferase n=1 Tax=Mobilicoccus pelagius NBRC 104925 TaxID=1089455 RepID=H5UQI8_9MICO|nr:putative glycosyltransferase [Mobilicoccus pelagius NBRC 104925]